MKQPPPPPPSVAAAFPPLGSPLVLPAFPSTTLESKGRSCNSSEAGPSSVTVEMGTGGRPVELLHNQKAILSQAPLIQSVPTGALGPVGPAPLPLLGPATQAAVTVPTTAQRQATQESLCMGLPPLAIPPDFHQAPVMPQVSQWGPWPQRPRAAGRLPTSQAKLPTPSVYQNFRRWQQFKTLIWKKLPQTPDVEALACFFIPVLRSLARLKPTMSLDEGLWRGLQEWEGISNYERMSYHVMAAKFMEFEATEEMENSKLQEMMHFQGQPPAVPLKPDSPRPSSLDILLQPDSNYSKTSLKTQRAQPSAPRVQRPPETNTSEEIPPEAVEEYMAIMDWLEGLPELSTHKSQGTSKEAGMEQQQNADDICSDPELLSLIDQLCSQEDFISNVEAIIHPTFLEGLLSSKPQLDLVALIEELEQEGLTPDQVDAKPVTINFLQQIVEKHLGAPRVARNDQSHQHGVSVDTSTLQIISNDDQSHGGTSTEQLMSDAAVLLQGGQGSPSVGATLPTASPHGHGSHPQHLGSGDAVNPMGKPPTGTPCKLAGNRRVDKEGIPSLTSLLGSEYSLLPWGISQSPKSSTIFLCSGHQALRPSLPKRRCQSVGPPPLAKSKKRALIGASCILVKQSHPGPCLEGSAKQDLALGLIQPSLPRKRKGEALEGQKKRRKKKKH
ncbi:NUT family member 2G-like [Perognathus longimembris pacificus]|uniref:NUT family member 2G-like n=1 Tax=Perognathus longimembris pacificus TaxID=214514 RepID=UPI002018A8D3|nr:NUT family member 2G-like [Perognathus longimembris pacificus]